MKTIMELYSQLISTFDDLVDNEIDTKWFEDLENRRSLYKKCPECFAHYNKKSNIPNYPICDKDGRPCLKIIIISLGRARSVKSKNSKIEGIDQIIQKLERLRRKHREYRTSVPSDHMKNLKNSQSQKLRNILKYL